MLMCSLRFVLIVVTIYCCAAYCTQEMIDKIIQLTDEEKNLLVFVVIQKLAKITKLDFDLVLNCLLGDMDSFMQFTEMLTNYV